MKRQKLIYGLLATSLILASASCKKDGVRTITAGPNLTSGIPQPLNSSSSYWNYAQQTHSFIVGNILTTYNSYRGNTTTEFNNAFEWYNTSQIYADAAFVKAGDSRYATFMNNTYTWMGNMWDTHSSLGGYFSSANLDGSGAGGDKYVDDCSVTALAYLDAYNVTTGTAQTNYLNSAKACANWMMNSGLWTSADGGGFYQRTGLGAVKPTQTNGLALQVFLKLYQITGQSFYHDWAISIKNWLEGNMYDSLTGLYVWEFDANGIKQNIKFTYDNAIMVEADLLYSSIIGDGNYVTKAQNLGISMNKTLWNTTYHVYIFNTNDQRVNPAWCVWGSQAMVRLYERDGNTAWLDYAQQNIDFMNTKLRNPTNFGYYSFVNLDGTARYTNFEGVDQSWMQRTQVLLSNYR